MFILTIFTLLILLCRQSTAQNPSSAHHCNYQLVESMPENMVYKQELPFELARTHQVFLDLINNATETVQLVSFYAALTPTAQEHIDHPSSIPGRLVLEALESAARDRNVKVEIILGFLADTHTTQSDLQRFKEAGVVVKRLDVTKILGAGIQHAKYLITDEKNFYLGSANLDWRSFTQVKEVGVSYTNCKELAGDLSKIFKTYSMLADDNDLIGNLPTSLSTEFTLNNPFKLIMDKVETGVSLSAAPREFNSQGDQRTDDIEAIVDMISKAKKFVYVSVMRFRSFNGRTYWPVIENALRSAVFERKVNVKLLIAKPEKMYEEELGFYRSLKALSFKNPRLGKIEIKLFTVPNDDPFHKSIPFSRVKHDKYIVTDRGVYIGTSNWEQDYFKNTCGVGISIIPDEYAKGGIVEDMTKIFHRDFYSDYSAYV